MQIEPISTLVKMFEWHFGHDIGCEDGPSVDDTITGAGAGATEHAWFFFRNDLKLN